MSKRNSERLKTNQNPLEPWPNKAATKEMKKLWENYWPLINVKAKGGTVNPIEVESVCDQMLQICNAKM